MAGTLPASDSPGQSPTTSFEAALAEMEREEADARARSKAAAAAEEAPLVRRGGEPTASCARALSRTVIG
jgi:DNA invertase Pin-like site-specific DNA recombinase